VPHRRAVGPRLDDGPWLGVACHLQVGEDEMVRAPVDAIDDGVGCAFEFVVEATLHQPAQDRLGCLVAVEREAAEVGLPLGCAHRPEAALLSCRPWPVPSRS